MSLKEIVITLKVVVNFNQSFKQTLSSSKNSVSSQSAVIYQYVFQLVIILSEPKILRIVYLANYRAIQADSVLKTF